MNAFDEYHELAAQLLNRTDCPLPLPNLDRDYPHNIGLLSDAEESELAAMVVQYTNGMNCDSWQELTLDQRLPWMRLAVGAFAAKDNLSMPAILQELARIAEMAIHVVDADQLSKWPKPIVEELIGAGILRRTDNAASVVCDACGDDHVEKIEYIQLASEPKPRAYISCPISGRIPVPLDRLYRWVIDKAELPETSLVAAQVGRQPGEITVSKRHQKKHTKDGAPKRSWTQSDLDEAIREYKAKRASNYNDLVDGVKRRRAGAKKSARGLFGRNAIVRALGVKSAAMVSGSPVWQTIADELTLRGRSRSTSTQKSQRIGLDIALEDQAEATSAPILDQAIQQETIRLIEKSMPAKEAEATIEKLRRGEITDDKARDLVEVFSQQQHDQRTRKIRQVP
jgi:hypothetical protein